VVLEVLVVLSRLQEITKEAEAALGVVMETGVPLSQVVCGEAEAEYGMPTFRVLVISNISLQPHREQLE
jgi:hypothetical protein